MTGYYTAQICQNGHVITEYVEEYPQDLEAYCSECGATTIKTCSKCNSNIRGASTSGDSFINYYTAPNYCFSCGEPFPWTKAAIESTNELLLLADGITPDDAKSLENSYHDLISDTPRTQVAAMKLKIILKKAGKATSDAVYTVLVDVLSEAVRKTIWPEI